MPTKRIIYTCNECQSQYKDIQSAKDCERQGKPTFISVGAFFKLRKAWANASDYALVARKTDEVCSLGHRTTNYAYEFTCDSDLNVYSHEENISIISFPDSSFRYLDDSVMEVKQLDKGEVEKLLNRSPIMKKALELVLMGDSPLGAMQKIQRDRDARRKKLRERRRNHEITRI